MSDDRTPSGHLSPLIVVQWLHFVIGAIDQEAANASRAHLSEGNLLLAG
jgi:uncharacterized membrane protein YsdA (DUF1294 family)